MSDLDIFIVLVFNLLVVLCYFYTFQKFLRSLQNNEKSIWLQLGEPNLITNNSIKSMLPTIKFLLSKRYMDSASSQVERYGGWARFMFFFSSFIIIVSSVFAIVMEASLFH